MPMDAIARLQEQLNTLRERQMLQDRSAAIVSTKLDAVQKSVDQLSVNASRVVWAIILAVLAAGLEMILR